jgi:hypothetical protein
MLSFPPEPKLVVDMILPLEAVTRVKRPKIVFGLLDPPYPEIAMVLPSVETAISVPSP